ncbi:MAG: alpha amylase C-terminal domain-containing protein, partial [Clostridia bacterium]|nr:alpha amylase C-terminal domain-containing protein [Clostridia bacterium]
LVDNEALRYGQLNAFDKAMVAFLKNENALSCPAEQRWLHEEDKLLIYTKGDTVFVFNFHPTRSFEGYFVPVGTPGVYTVALTSDDEVFGGFSRVDTAARYQTVTTPENWVGFPCYLPCRSALVLKRECLDTR